MTTNHRRSDERLTRRQIHAEIALAADLADFDPFTTAPTARALSTRQIRRALGRSRRVLRELSSPHPPDAGCNRVLAALDWGYERRRS